MALFSKNSKKSKVDLTQISDEQLVDICKQELPETTTAYKVLISRYEGLIYNTCYKILGNPQDAEEVAQDTLVQIFHKLHQFQGRSSFKTWLYRIVHNYCKNRISKQIRHRKRQNALEEHAEIFTSDTYDDRVLNENSELVNITLDKLKPKEREIIILKFMSGLTIEEIADVLDIGLSACKMRLYRSLDAFKIAYNRVLKEPLPKNKA